MPLDVSAVVSAVQANPVSSTTRPSPAAQSPGDSFQKTLSNAVESLNTLQTEADASAAMLASGGPVEIHEALLATEEANLAFQLAVQVRNKVVEAYQEVMRMQV